MTNNLFNSNFAKNSKFDYDFVGKITNKKEWMILVKQYDNYVSRNVKINNDGNIPKKIHQIWLGNKKLPKKYLKWMNSWKTKNKDWEYKLWDENNIQELGIKYFNVYSKKINPGYRSDIIRYLILKKFGGIYVDTDFECIKPIPKNLLDYKFVSCIIFGNKPIIANGMMMSAPDYVLINKILNSINPKAYINDINEILKNSGPEKLTNEYFSLAEMIEDETLILPSNYFYPYTNFMLNRNLNKYNEIQDVSIGFHHWEMSWMRGTIFKRIRNKLKKYLSNIIDLIKNI